MQFDEYDEETLGQLIARDYRDFVNGCLSNGQLPPWMDIDNLLDRDERALLSMIADHGRVAWSGMLGSERRTLAMRLGFESVGNLKATVHKAQSRGLTRHYIDDGVEWIDMAMYGRWILDIVDGCEDE